MRRLPNLAALLLVAIMFSRPSAADDAALEGRAVAEVLAATNRERSAAGLKPLTLNAQLSASAAWMAADMAKNAYFSHSDRHRRAPKDRITAFGYRDWAMVGENLAGGQESATSVVAAWMKSAGHRANILDTAFTEIGIARVYEPMSPYRYYWVQTFGRPQSASLSAPVQK